MDRKINGNLLKTNLNKQLDELKLVQIPIDVALLFFAVGVESNVLFYTNKWLHSQHIWSKSQTLQPLLL